MKNIVAKEIEIKKNCNQKKDGVAQIETSKKSRKS